MYYGPSFIESREERSVVDAKYHLFQIVDALSSVAVAVDDASGAFKFLASIDPQFKNAYEQIEKLAFSASDYADELHDKLELGEISAHKILEAVYENQ